MGDRILERKHRPDRPGPAESVDQLAGVRRHLRARLGRRDGVLCRRGGIRPWRRVVHRLARGLGDIRNARHGRARCAHVHGHGDQQRRRGSTASISYTVAEPPFVGIGAPASGGIYEKGPARLHGIRLHRPQLRSRDRIVPRLQRLRAARFARHLHDRAPHLHGYRDQSRRREINRGDHLHGRRASDGNSHQSGRRRHLRARPGRRHHVLVR